MFARGHIFSSGNISNAMIACAYSELYTSTVIMVLLYEYT